MWSKEALRQSHDGVEEEVLHGHETSAQEVVDHNPVVVHRVQRREELGRDCHERQMLDIRVCMGGGDQGMRRESMRRGGSCSG